MRARPPGLYRLSRLFGRLATLAVVVVIVVVVLAGYSASRIRPETPAGGLAGQSLLSNGTVEITDALNVSNPGLFEFTSLQVAAEVALAGGNLLGVGGSPPITIPAGATGSIPLVLYLPLAAVPAAAGLLRNDSDLPVSLWLNATYADLVSVAVSAATTFAWGAPFAGFTANVGSPTVLSNGTVLVPVAVQFQNHAFFADSGTVTVRVLSASGQTCAAPTVSVDTPAGGSFNQTFDIYGSAGCDPSGGQAIVTYSGNGLTLTLPPEAIP